MNNYIDKYGRYHDKPVTDLKPISSNNGWIYTAYAEKLGLPINYLTLEECFNHCKVSNKDLDNKLALVRTPGKNEPPISRDEILGMASLGFLKPRHLNGWNFSPYAIPRFNPIKLIAQLWDLRPSLNRHRNYFWQNNLDQLYRFAFSVPLSDRHFILKKWGKFNPIYWLIAKIDSKLKGDNGIPWLKYGGDDRKTIMKEEFSEDHPFRSL